MMLGICFLRERGKIGVIEKIANKRQIFKVKVKLQRKVVPLGGLKFVLEAF